MAFQLRENTATLFKNDRKDSDSHPNAKGEALINGVAYWVSAWTKKDKNGNPWQSLSFTPKDSARNVTPAPKQAPPAIPEDIPF